VRDDRTTRPILLADASRVPHMSSMRCRLCAMTWIAWTRPVRITSLSRRDVTELTASSAVSLLFRTQSS
jgi:hypothetical protein